MTSPQPAGEPTLRDVLDAIGAVARVQGEHGAAIAALAAGQNAVRDDVAGIKSDLGTLRLDFHAYVELAESRHTETTQTLEAISGIVHQQQQAIAALPEFVTGEVGRAEARLTSRIEDVQRVVQAIKADLAAHTSDTQLHRGSHGKAA